MTSVAEQAATHMLTGNLLEIPVVNIGFRISSAPLRQDNSLGHVSVGSITAFMISVLQRNQQRLF